MPHEINDVKREREPWHGLKLVYRDGRYLVVDREGREVPEIGQRRVCHNSIYEARMKTTEFIVNGHKFRVSPLLPDWDYLVSGPGDYSVDVEAGDPKAAVLRTLGAWPGLDRRTRNYPAELIVEVV
jgi:hypothetical protein